MAATHPIGWIAAFGALYLILLARSAWKQNQLRQFGLAILYVAVFASVLTLVAAAGIWLQRS